MSGRPRLRGRHRLAAGAIAAVTLLAGCQVDVHLTVDVDRDGSGSLQARFQLDDEAVEALGGDLESSLRVDDLVESGWEVESEDVDGGGAVVTATRGFSTVDQLGEAVDELSGDVGPFRDFALERETALFTTSFDLTGTVDLSGGVGPSALDPDDPALVEGLAAEGVEVEELRAFVRDRIDSAFSFSVVVALPGSGSHNAPATIGGEPAWTPRVGERLELTASSSDVNVRSIVLLAVAGFLAIVAVAVAAGRLGPDVVRRLRSATGRRMRPQTSRLPPPDREG